jgi:DNA-binding MarR family transcriptional regulator
MTDWNGIVDLLSLVRAGANRYITNSLISRGIDGIVPAHGQLLMPLFKASGPIPLGDLARCSGRAKSTITGMAHTLEKQGYISRSNCPDDKRSILVELTSEGRRLEGVFNEISAELIRDLYGDMPVETRIRLMDDLSVLEKNLADVASDKALRPYQRNHRSSCGAPAEHKE